MLTSLLALAISTTALALLPPQPSRAQGDVDQQLGSVHFKTSCNEVAQRRFDRAMRYQHSYWYLNAKELFEEALKASFGDLDISDRGTTDYMSDILVRFMAAGDLWPLGVTGERMETLADRVAEIERSWQVDGPHFDPKREVELRRGIGDYTLFMTGFFWERVKADSVTRFFVREGKRAYRFVANFHRAQGHAQAACFATLAGRFETCAAVMSYMRDVHLGAEFAPWPHRLFARIITR